MVVLKYFNFKKDVGLNAHVTMFNSVIKANAETSQKYIINVFSFMLKNTTLDRCHDYILEFPNFIFSKFTHAFCKCHQKTQNDKQIYIELKNMKQGETKKVEVYYEHIQKTVHGLQILTINNFMTIVFKSRFVIIPQNYDYKDEVINTTT